MITYIDVPGSAMICCKVKLDKKIVGAIYNFGGTYYYRPAGGVSGEMFKTIDEVKASLES